MHSVIDYVYDELDMLNIASRLVQADIVTNPSKHFEDAAVSAGRQAEKKVEDQLISLGGIPAYNVFHALRIPNGMQTGRVEIDLVVLTDDKIYCLEVKNWSGEITYTNNNIYWQQRVTKDNKKVKQIQHTCPIRRLKEKALLLRSHLSRAGLFLPESTFIAKVVLVNPNGNLDERIKTSSCVITPDALSDFANKFAKPLSAYLIDPLVPYFFRGQFSYNQMDQIRRVLNLVGTWDVLELHGGKVLHGDYKGCAEIVVNRKEADVIEFAHQRNKTTATFWAVLGYAPTTTAHVLKRGEGWWLFGKETLSTISLPFNGDIGFRVAGNSVDSKIPINDINKIILSC